MSEFTVQRQSPSFRIGWGVLLFLAAGNVLSHIGLFFFDAAETIFIAWSAFNLLATAILVVPYRRGEKWAWYVIWGLIIPYALIIFVNSEVGLYYLAEAVVMGLGQVLTYGAFFAPGSSNG